MTGDRRARELAAVALWALAVACEYISPMFGFAFPGLGRSRTREWTIEGGHLAERCQLFVIVALGETLLATGGVLSEVEHWSGAVVSAVLATFAGTLAMWWLYFGISSRDATDTITRSDDPGRIGAYFHYVHALLIAGIIAKFIMPGKDPGGCIITIVIGVVGALLGGFIATYLGFGGISGFDWRSLFIAIIGALLLLAIWRMISGRRR